MRPAWPFSCCSVRPAAGGRVRPIQPRPIPRFGRSAAATSTVYIFGSLHILPPSFEWRTPTDRIRHRRQRHFRFRGAGRRCGHRAPEGVHRQERTSAARRVAAQSAQPDRVRHLFAHSLGRGAEARTFHPLSALARRRGRRPCLCPPARPHHAQGRRRRDHRAGPERREKSCAISRRSKTR